MAEAAAVTPHVVVFADLSPRAKVQYTRFLIENDVKVCSPFYILSAALGALTAALCLVQSSTSALRTIASWRTSA